MESRNSGNKDKETKKPRIVIWTRIIQFIFVWVLYWDNFGFGRTWITTGCSLRSAQDVHQISLTMTNENVNIPQLEIKIANKDGRAARDSSCVLDILNDE